MTVIRGVFDKQKIDEKIRLERLQRYAAQSVARKALEGERVGTCLRHRLGSFVSIWQHKESKKAFYAGLMVCGSVWACPVCAAKIAERRKKELQLAFSQHQERGGQLALLTLTFSHKKTDKLADTLERFSKATQKLFSGKAYNGIRQDMEIIGRIRVFEVTYGVNGFHPHLHIAIFYNNAATDLSVMKNKMYKLWANACVKHGLTSSKKYGLDLQSAEHAQDYLAKHGTWSLEQELSKAHIKVAKNDSMTPFDFLRRYLVTEDEKYLELFREYYRCFKGRRQIHWSIGLKQMFELEDKTDEELAKEKIEEADALGLIGIDDWKEILKHEQRGQLLNNVERYGFHLGFEKTFKKISPLSLGDEQQTH